MTVWRLCRQLFSPLDGIGAMRHGGRWNSPGQFMVYTSANLSLALLEVLVNLEVEYEDLPDDLVSIKIDLPDELVHDRVVAPGDVFALNETRALGDQWLEDGESVSVRVPSVVVPKEDNICLNPKHPDFDHVHTLDVAPFSVDSRLFRPRR